MAFAAPVANVGGGFPPPSATQVPVSIAATNQTVTTPKPPKAPAAPDIQPLGNGGATNKEKLGQ